MCTANNKYRMEMARINIGRFRSNNLRSFKNLRQDFWTVKSAQVVDEATLNELLIRDCAVGLYSVAEQLKSQDVDVIHTEDSKNYTVKFTIDVENTQLYVNSNVVVVLKQMDYVVVKPKPSLQ